MVDKAVQGLPLGTSSFEALRKANQIYVDKTAIIYSLASKRNKYFLARPRRFGKSLLISTFESLFKNGLRDFENLAIQQLWQENNTFLVVKLDFSLASEFNTIEEFKSVFRSLIGLNFRELGYDFSSLDNSFYISLSLFLQGLKTNSLVLLIDEYDAPLTSCLNNPQLFEAIRQETARFYATIKSADKAFRFLFITGITKFGKISIFSSLNNLLDLTLTKSATTLLGYTKEELENNFDWYLNNACHVLDMPRKQLIDTLSINYYGFRFSGELDACVFSPWSILNFLNMPAEGFQSYWIESGGGSKALRQHVKAKTLKQPADFFMPKQISIDSLRSPSDEIRRFDDLVLLAQTGYLTIKSVGSFTFDIGYPNREVADALGALYRESMWTDKQMDNLDEPKLATSLSQGNVANFIATLNKYFFALDYLKFPIRNESVCRNYTQLVLMDRTGIDVFAETHNALRRSDLEIRTRDFYWILEIKFIPVDQETPELITNKLEEAKIQMMERQYEGSEISERKLISLGAVFSEKQRQFIVWKQIPRVS